MRQMTLISLFGSINLGRERLRKGLPLRICWAAKFSLITCASTSNIWSLKFDDFRNLVEEGMDQIVTISSCSHFV